VYRVKRLKKRPGPNKGLLSHGKKRGTKRMMIKKKRKEEFREEGKLMSKLMT
jgi:hypothetical protein